MAETEARTYYDVVQITVSDGGEIILVLGDEGEDQDLGIALDAAGADALTERLTWAANSARAIDA